MENTSESMIFQRATVGLNDKDSVYIRYCTDGSLVDLRQLKAHSKTMGNLVQELLFADDTALISHTETALQRIMSCFAEAAKLFGLEVSLKKTEVFHQPTPQEDSHSPCITIGESELKTIQQFSYLGSIISSDAKVDKEIDNRQRQTVHSADYKRVWTSKHLKKGMKIYVYRAAVLTTLLHGFELWVTYHHHL